jgi:hypothetical protein
MGVLPFRLREEAVAEAEQTVGDRTGEEAGS